MPDIIQLLPDSTANRIAAGEVVQRPASVVKELLENALDAGASRIKLTLRNAGKSMIQVSDNGCGMTETDARMCFERHATSKLKHVDDLFDIRTMGFRGEALASIASVAQVELQTKRAEDTMGTRLVIEGSVIKVQEPCACLTGTTITVRNLFFNVPARHKFLKSDTVELRHAQDEFLRIALAYPDLFFSLVHNDKENYHLPVSPVKKRILNALGKTLEDKLVRVEEDTDVVQISGFVGTSASAKKRRGEQFFFVNKRFIKSPYLHHAVKTAYGEMIETGKHPSYVIFLEMDPARVDVNVHPSKQEVKFEDERILYNYLMVACRHAIGSSQSVPSLDFNRLGTGGFHTNDHQTSRPTGSGAGGYTKDPLTQREQNNLSNWKSLYEVGADSRPMTIPSAMGSTSGAELFRESETTTGYTLYHNYLAIPVESGVILLDRVAAEAKILYEQFLDSFSEDRQIARQKEIFPATIHLSAADSAMMPDVMPILNAFGFELQEFGDNSYINYAVPAIGISDISLEAVLNDLLESFKADRPARASRAEYFAARLATRLSHKRRSKLSSNEIIALRERLQQLDLQNTAPTGRKCLIHLSGEELKRLFSS